MTTVTVQNTAGVDYNSYITAFTDANVFSILFAPIVGGTTITIDLGNSRSVVFTGVFTGTQVISGSGPVTQIQFQLNGTPDVTATGMTFTLQDLLNGALAGDAALLDVLFGEVFLYTGNNGGDVFISGYLDDTISGLGGDDSLNGGYGNDKLDGGTGNDTLTGFFGNDTYVNPNAGDTLVETGGTAGGIDTVQSATTFSISSLADIENVRLTGGADANAIGNGAINRLLGNSGDNILNGGGENDIMTGGAGNDTFYVNSAGDQTIEELNQGTADHVISSITRNLSNNIENLTLTGTANLDGNGNGLNNIINGNAGNNVMRGSGGNDTLNGQAGVDVMLGGAGRDTLNPGVDTVRDTVKFNAASESTGVTRDLVIGMDLNGEDKFDFPALPAGLGFVNTGALNTATFDANLAAAVNATLAVNGAVLFNPVGGTLDVLGHAYLVVDGNGDGVYSANQDYVVQLVNFTGTLTSDDFI